MYTPADPESGRPTITWGSSMPCFADCVLQFETDSNVFGADAFVSGRPGKETLTLSGGQRAPVFTVE